MPASLAVIGLKSPGNCLASIHAVYKILPPEKSVMLACCSPKLSSLGALIRLTNKLYHFEQ
jgi:hypothetical protein